MNYLDKTVDDDGTIRFQLLTVGPRPDELYMVVTVPNLGLEDREVYWQQVRDDLALRGYLLTNEQALGEGGVALLNDPRSIARAFWARTVMSQEEMQTVVARIHDALRRSGMQVRPDEPHADVVEETREITDAELEQMVEQYFVQEPDRLPITDAELDAAAIVDTEEPDDPPAESD